MSENEAERDTVRRFGPAGESSRPFDRFAVPLRFLLGSASVVTVGVGLWLFWVINFVLPARDPAHIPMWRVVAICFLGYSALSLAYLIRGPRSVALRWSVLALSVAAIGLGLYGIIAMIRAAAVGSHFEGYIFLMGLILGGHGVCAVAYTILTRRSSRRLHSA